MFDAKGTINKVMLIGRLGQSPDLKYSSSGTAILNLSVATNSKSKDVTKTDWHRVVAYQKLAETIAQYAQKGSQVYIEGRLQTRSYEKDGKKQFITEVIANQIQLLGGRGDQQSGQSNQSEEGWKTDDDISELPF